MRDTGPARACFGLAENGRIILLTSELILAEVRDVLNRPRIHRHYSEVTSERIERFIGWVREFSVVLTDVESVFHLERDPKDSHYVDVAIAGKARYLVSRDKDLLELDSDATFASRFSQLTVVNPVAFLETISDQTQTASRPDAKDKRP